MDDKQHIINLQHRISYLEGCFKKPSTLHRLPQLVKKINEHEVTIKTQEDTINKLTADLEEASKLSTMKARVYNSCNNAIVINKRVPMEGSIKHAI